MTRDLVWDGCVNVRDLGGLPTEGGGETRFGSIVRADNVRRLSDEGWKAVAGYGVSTVVDLRWAEELAEDPPPALDLHVVHVSLFGDYDRAYGAELEERLARLDPITEKRAYVEAATDEADRERRHRLSGAPAAAMSGVIHELERRHGSVGGSAHGPEVAP